jgi:hypothetical protein
MRLSRSFRVCNRHLKDHGNRCMVSYSTRACIVEVSVRGVRPPRHEPLIPASGTPAGGICRGKEKFRVAYINHNYGARNETKKARA